MLHGDRQHARLGTILSLCWIVSGCINNNATGHFFQPASELSAEQSVVYLYFPRPDVGSNWHQEILVNETSLTKLDIGGYYSYVTSPDHKTFSLTHYAKTSHVPLKMQGGYAYFLKVHLLRKGLKGEVYELVEVTESEAIEEIQRCRLMKPLQ